MPGRDQMETPPQECRAAIRLAQGEISKRITMLYNGKKESWLKLRESQT